MRASEVLGSAVALSTDAVVEAGMPSAEGSAEENFAASNSRTSPAPRRRTVPVTARAPAYPGTTESVESVMRRTWMAEEYCEVMLASMFPSSVVFEKFVLGITLEMDEATDEGSSAKMSTEYTIPEPTTSPPMDEVGDDEGPAVINSGSAVILMPRSDAILVLSAERLISFWPKNASNITDTIGTVV